MKKLTLTTVLIAIGTASVFAQATVTLRSGSVHVGNPDGTPVGAGVFAQMLGAPGSNAPESSLLPGLGIASFRTGAAAGELAFYCDIQQYSSGRCIWFL
jgi:hypothetical protein